MALDVKLVGDDALDHGARYSLLSYTIAYFRCPSNGFFADSYGCAQGKYFECVERSEFVCVRRQVIRRVF